MTNVSQNIRTISLPGNRLQPTPMHPREILLDAMSDRGWHVKDLAARMHGDHLLNRALIWHYLRHPTGDILLGSMMAHRLDEAFGFGIDHFLKFEKTWVEHRRAAAKAGAP